MNKLATVSALAALAIAGQAAAADFSYNYVEGDLLLADTGSLDGKGPGISGSTNLPQLHPNAMLFGGANYLDFEAGLHVLNLDGGLGFHWPLGPLVDFTGGASLEYVQDNFHSGNSDIGLGLNGGVRARPFGKDWELFGGLKYINAGVLDDTLVEVGARYTFQPGLSAGLKLSSGDIDTWVLSLRWEM